ncbi:hypothetical protein Tco_1171173, partial [Tanacetum coccineum]
YDGEALELKISKVNKLSYKQFCDLLSEKVEQDIWHWFYCKPDCSLEDGLTIVENDRDVKKMYEMANLHGLLEVYVSHIPQLEVTDYYFKNLCVDESNAEVTSQLRSHQKIKKEIDSYSLEEMIAWEQKESQSPCYLISPNPLKPKRFGIDLLNLNSYSCDEIVLDVFYNGCFLIYPLKYGGEALELKISKVNKFSYKQFCDLLTEKVEQDIWHWFYCKPDCSLEKGLTIVENDRDVKKMYEMANLHGLLGVYVSHIPQLEVTDYYLKNLCVDESDAEVTSQLRSHQKIKKEIDSYSLEEMIAWEQKESQSPCYLISPNPLKPTRLGIDLKGKSLLDDFEFVEGEGLGSSSSNFPGETKIANFMKLFFNQQIVEDNLFAKVLRYQADDMRSRLTKMNQMRCEMEAKED